MESFSINTWLLLCRFSVSDDFARSLVKEEAARLREYIKREVKGRLLSIKVDSTSKDGRPFFGVNIQFSEGGAIQLRTLTVREVFLRQTAENLKLLVLEVLGDYGIEIENVLTVTCDNGKNMLRAADLLKQVQDKTDDLIDAEQEEIELQLSHHLETYKCAAHTLQLAVDDDALKLDGEIQELLDKCQSYITILRSESWKKRLKKVYLPIPVLANKTRWCTTYFSLSSLLRLEGFLRQDQDDDDDEAVLTDDDWCAIHALLETLEPPMVATKKLQAEQLTLGDAYGVWLECKLKLNKQCSPLAQEISRNMTKREKRETFARSNRERAGQEKNPPLFENPGFLSALFLDPRYFSCLEEDDVVQAKSWLKDLWVRISRSKTTENLEEEEENEQSEEVDDILDDEDELSALIRERDSRRRRESSDHQRVQDITNILDSYYIQTPLLKDRTYPILKYWEERKFVNPELYELAKIVHAIPATQVSVERLFSSLRFILNRLRSCLSSQMVEDLVVIFSNSALIKQDILLLMENVST